MRNNLRNIILSALVVVSLAGCTTSSTSTSTSDSNVLRVGMECNYAPFNWTTTTPTDTTQSITSVDYADGYDVVIATRIAQQLGKEVQIVKLDWDNLILSLQHGEIDAVIAGMTDTEARRKEVNFTTPYYVSEEVIIVRKDSDVASITNIQELAGYQVIGQMNTIYDEIIDQIDGVIHMPASETFPAAIQALQAGGVDAVTSELPVAIGVTSANPDLMYISFTDGNGFTDENGDATVSIAIAKENEELLQQVQEALDTISDQEREQLMIDATNRQPAGE